MPRKCICDWQEFKENQRILKAAGHVLSGHKDLFFNDNDPESRKYKQPVFDSFKSYDGTKKEHHLIALHHWHPECVEYLQNGSEIERNLEI